MTKKNASEEVRDQFLNDLVSDQKMHPIAKRLASLHFLPSEGWDEEVVQRAIGALAHFEECTPKKTTLFLAKVQEALPDDLDRATQLKFIMAPFFLEDLASSAAIDLLVIMAALKRPDLLPT